MERDAQVHSQQKTMRLMEVRTHTRLQHIRVFAIALQAFHFTGNENTPLVVVQLFFFF